VNITRSDISWNYSIQIIADLLKKSNWIVKYTQNGLSAVTNEGYPRFHIKIWKKKKGKITIEVHQEIAPHKGRNNKHTKNLLSRIISQIKSFQSRTKREREIYVLPWGKEYGGRI